MQFNGLYTAMITPFRSDETLDLAQWETLVQRQVEANVTGIIIAGTTGESPNLSRHEITQLIQCAHDIKRQAQSDLQIIVGTGTNSTYGTIDRTQDALKDGAEAVMIVNPYYNKPSQEGLKHHFDCIGKTISAPIMLYNIPGRTHVNMLPETVIELNQTHPHICVIKEASGIQSQADHIIANSDMAVLAGDDQLARPMIQAGGHGLASVTSNLLPQEMANYIQSIQQGNPTQADTLEQLLMPLFEQMLTMATNPEPIKAAMAMANWCSPAIRSPMMPLNSATHQSLQTLLSQLKVID